MRRPVWQWELNIPEVRDMIFYFLLLFVFHSACVMVLEQIAPLGDCLMGAKLSQLTCSHLRVCQCSCRCWKSSHYCRSESSVCSSQIQRGGCLVQIFIRNLRLLSSTSLATWPNSPKWHVIFKIGRCAVRWTVRRLAWRCERDCCYMYLFYQGTRHFSFFYPLTTLPGLHLLSVAPSTAAASLVLKHLSHLFCHLPKYRPLFSPHFPVPASHSIHLFTPYPHSSFCLIKTPPLGSNLTPALRLGDEAGLIWIKSERLNRNS